MRIRASIATASILHLRNYRIKVEPTTLYFMLSGKCEGSCLYCTHRKGYLSRIKWPEFSFKEVKSRIGKTRAKRICIQCPYMERCMDALKKILEEIKNEKPISLSISAISKEEMKMLKEEGVERIGIGLDCATEEIFNKWKKGVPSWKKYMEAIKNAKEIFGDATCHLIIGLGESDEEAISLMENMKKKGVRIALFAYFWKNKNVVDIHRYRVMQIARYVIEKGTKRKFLFENGRLLEMEIDEIDKKAFMTAGCPSCNRPFYNERVTKIYNYPYLLSEEEFERAVKEARKYAGIYIASE